MKQKSLQKGILSAIILCIAGIAAFLVWRGREAAPPPKLELEPSYLAMGLYNFWFWLEDGDLVVWGNDIPYQERKTVFENAVSVWGTYYGVLVLDGKGDLWVCGEPNIKQETGASRWEWTYLLSDVVKADAMLWHGAAVCSDGSLWTWGHNDHGQLGNGELGIGNTNYPVQHIMDGVRDVYTDLSGTAIITWDNDLMAWGSWGALSEQTTPTFVCHLDGAVDFGALPGSGYQILRQDGALERFFPERPEERTVLCESGVAAVHGAAYVTEEGGWYLWDSSRLEDPASPGPLYLGTGIQQVVPIDGIYIIREDQTLHAMYEENGRLLERDIP